MLDIPVVDAHAHIYPAKIAAKAVAAVGEFYDYDGMFGGGTPEDLIQDTNDSPISNFIVHSVATTPHAVDSINQFIAETVQKYPQMVGFGTMHPDYEDKEAAVEKAIEMGLRGFKLHPDTQMVNMDDPRLMEFYEIIAGRLPLTMHTGDYRYTYSDPARLVKILDAFPDLVVDAAHLGGWSIFDVGYDELHRNLVGRERLFVDASSSFAWIGRRHMRELVRMWGADRVMFGSDYPMWNPNFELNEMLNCDLTDDELELILYRNAEDFARVKFA